MVPGVGCRGLRWSMTALREWFEEQGYAVIPQLLTLEETAALRNACGPHLQPGPTVRPGVRRILAREAQLLPLLRKSSVPAVIREIAGPGATIVRSILFDKSSETNWMVPWHQDAVIAVRERADVPEFGPWSVKDGEPHCRPPRALLDQIVVLRLALDPCPSESGPLLVLPGSHLGGLLTSAELDAVVASGPQVECTTPEGGAVLMRPHLAHASGRSTSGARRRVLHLEFTSASLPRPLEWAEAVRV